jgi:hypothetical protein
MDKLKLAQNNNNGQNGISDDVTTSYRGNVRR